MHTKEAFNKACLFVSVSANKLSTILERKKTVWFYTLKNYDRHHIHLDTIFTGQNNE